MARYLITSALPYINGIKHLGNLAGSMLPADIHARFRRLQGHEVLFICATRGRASSRTNSPPPPASASDVD
jgi:methionyl-tRNA synthetase